MGPPPRSLTAEANSCFMVRVLHGPNRIQGCGASIAPERGLPSDQLYRTSNNEGHRVAVTLDTKVLIQGCVKTPMANFRVELPSRFRRCKSRFVLATTFGRRQLRKRFCASLARASFHTALYEDFRVKCYCNSSIFIVRGSV